MVNYFPETYGTNDVIAKMDAQIIYFTQLSNITSKKYAKAFWNKLMICNCIHDEHFLERIFIKRLHGSIWHRACSCLSSKKSTMVHDLVRQFTSLTNFQHKLHLLYRGHTKTEQKHNYGKNDRTSSGRSIAVIPLAEGSTKVSRRQLSSNPSLLSMALQLPTQRVVTARPFHQRFLADKIPFCYLCFDMAHSTSRFIWCWRNSSRSSQISAQRICQHSCIVEHTRRAGRSKAPGNTQGERVHYPHDLCSSGLYQQLIYRGQQRRLQELPQSSQKLKTGGTRAEPFENLDRPADDISHDKTTKVFTTNVIAAVITNLEASCWELPMTKTPWNRPKQRW